MADLDDSYGATLALNDNPPPLDPISAPATDEVAQVNAAPEARQESAPAPYGVGNYLGNVATTVGDIPGMVMRGGATGIAELLYSSGILDESQITKAREYLKMSSEMAKREGVNPVVNALGEGVAQFLPAFLPVFSGLKAIGLGRIGASMVAEAVSGAFSFNPDEPNIANMALEHVDQKELLGVVTKLMATDPSDGDAMNRIRNGIQDMAIVGAFDGLVHAVPKAWAAARGRVAEDKSPIPMGGSIEDVGPGGKVPGDPVDLLFRTYYGGANLTPSASKKIKKIMSEAGGKTWKEMEAALLSNDGLKNRIRDVVSGVKETRSKGRWPAKIDLTTVDGVFSALRQKLGATFDGKGSNSKYMHTADGTAYRVSDHKSATRRSDQSDLFIEVYPEDDGMKIVAGDNEVMLPWGSKELTSRDGLQKIIDAIQPTGGKVPGEERLDKFGVPLQPKQTREEIQAAIAAQRSESYKMQHTAPTSDSSPTGDNLELAFPDIYGANGKQYYGTGSPYDDEALNIIRGMKNNPDADVTIYRAVPDNIDTINSGDFVTTTRQYASDHIGSDEGYHIIEKRVKANELANNGDSIHEFGYSPAGGKVPGGEIQIDPAPANISPAVEFRIQESPKIPTASGKVGPGEIGQYWDADYAARYGRQGDPSNPQDMDIAIRNGVAESAYQLDQLESGKGWYDADMAQTWDTASEAFPELEKGTVMPGNPNSVNFKNGEDVSPEAMRIITTAIASPLSFGNRPKPNFNTALKVLDGWLTDGEIPHMNPETGKLWTMRKVSSESLQFIQHMINKNGVEGTAEWLMSMHTVREIRDARRSAGIWKDSAGMSVPGKADDSKLGAFSLGRKGGPFFLNLNGISDTTADLWFTRTWNRQFGRMTSPNLASGEAIINQPRGAERGGMKEWNQEVAGQLGESEQDNQAILWYFEQQLFNAMGQTSAKPSKFSDGAKQFRDAGERGKYGNR